MTGRLINNLDDVAEGARWLCEKDPRFIPALRASGSLPLRRRAAGFSNLLNAIVAQQISVAAAQSVWVKMQTADLTTARKIAASSDDNLRQCGLSRQKILYAKSLATSGLSYRALAVLPDDQVIKTLCEIKGIGVWTAEIYAMFSLGRADVFAAGDLALQEAARALFALNARPSEKMLREMAQAWSPWRAVAARALWAYYRVMKNREGTL
ncbi:MAG: DNA-3-methyladenine glycosylase 2 family protein [Alphaproteobacteria bacterium]|nr:DNA-3-methyladenine glycosylase 2 family protein [Alphaproteobacteria bacterium]